MTLFLVLRGFLARRDLLGLRVREARFGLAFDRAFRFPRLGRLAFAARRFAMCCSYRKLPILSRSDLAPLNGSRSYVRVGPTKGAPNSYCDWYNHRGQVRVAPCPLAMVQNHHDGPTIR